MLGGGGGLWAIPRPLNFKGYLSWCPDGKNYFEKHVKIPDGLKKVVIIYHTK